MEDAYKFHTIGKVRTLFAQNGIVLDIALNVLQKAIKIGKAFADKLILTVTLTWMRQDNAQVVIKATV